MLAVSAGIDKITSDDTADDSTDDNRSRMNRSIWDNDAVEGEEW
jgi:hypothetical protein